MGSDVTYYINGKMVAYEDFVMEPSRTHKCEIKRYVGLSKVIEYCDCGKEKVLDWREIGEAKNENTD